MADLSIKKEPGIVQPAPASRPLNEPAPLSGPAYWAATGNDRQGAFAQNGEYWGQEPNPVGTGPDNGRLMPSSDMTGSMDMAALHMAGRYGPKPMPGEPPAVDNC